MPVLAEVQCAAFVGIPVEMGAGILSEKTFLNRDLYALRHSALHWLENEAFFNRRLFEKFLRRCDYFPDLHLVIETTVIQISSG